MASVAELELTAEQRENLERGEVTPMQVGVFGCRYTGRTASEEDDCDYSGLWEAPLAEWFTPECPECQRSALLVEVVDEHRH